MAKPYVLYTERIDKTIFRVKYREKYDHPRTFIVQKGVISDQFREHGIKDHLYISEIDSDFVTIRTISWEGVLKNALEHIPKIVAEKFNLKVETPSDPYQEEED